MTVFENERSLAAYAKAAQNGISPHTSSLSTVVQRDSRESVVISPPSIAGRADQAKGIQPSTSAGIGVNIHRSKQGVFVVRLDLKSMLRSYHPFVDIFT